MTSSEHFSVDAWADFARDVTAPDVRTDMEEHLKGCSKCTELHRDFRAVCDIAATDGLYEPPESTVRVAKAAYRFEKPAGFFHRATQTVKVLFDSRLMPALDGVRNVSAGPRKIVLASGDLIIDLQVAQSHEPRGTVLIGQLSAASQAHRRLQGLIVLLHRGSQRIAKATTNQIGEFQMEFDDPAEDLTLAVGSDPETTIIPLGTL